MRIDATLDITLKLTYDEFCLLRFALGDGADYRRDLAEKMKKEPVGKTHEMNAEAYNKMLLALGKVQSGAEHRIDEVSSRFLKA